jgi:hypothetical protein
MSPRPLSSENRFPGCFELASALSELNTPIEMPLVWISQRDDDCTNMNHSRAAPLLCNPSQSPCDRVDLIVMTAVWECEQLRHVVSMRFTFRVLP